MGVLATGMTADRHSTIQQLRDTRLPIFNSNTGIRFPRVFDSPRGVGEAYGGYCAGGYAVGLLIVGMNDEKGLQVLKVHPAGHYLPFKGTASGSKEQEATNYLEE